MTFSRIFEGAREYWRGDRDLLLRVSAVFFFLPALALQLFVAIPDAPAPAVGDAPTLQQFWEIHFPAFAPILAPLAVAMLVNTYGMAIIMVLLIDEDRPALGQAMMRAAGLLPLLVVASTGGFLLVMLGIIPFIIPGFYLVGRTLLIGPVLVGERLRNPFGAIARSIALTRGHGWKLLLAWLAVALGMQACAGIFAGIDMAKMPLVGAVAGLAIAGIAAAGSILLVLIQISAYRALSPRQGI